MNQLKSIGACALSSFATVQASYGIAEMCIDQEIPGDFVECGVFAGAQAAAMALAIMEWDPGGERKVHLFDSFCGIPKAGIRDHDIRPLVGSANQAGDIETSGVSVCSIDLVKRYMASWGIDPALLVYHPGWFQDTVPAAEIGAIAILRLDGDLYDSTKICLEHLYPKLSPGGWCIADDFNLDGCRLAIDEMVGQPHPMYWRKEPS